MFDFKIFIRRLTPRHLTTVAFDDKNFDSCLVCFSCVQFSIKHSYQVLNSFGPSHALVWAAIRVAGWTDKSTMKDRGHLPDGSLPICHGKLTNVQDGQSGLLCNVSIPFSAQQKMKKESWLPQKIDCRMDLSISNQIRVEAFNVPQLTQASFLQKYQTLQMLKTLIFASYWGSVPSQWYRYQKKHFATFFL